MMARTFGLSVEVAYQRSTHPVQAGSAPMICGAAVTPLRTGGSQWPRAAIARCSA